MSSASWSLEQPLSVLTDELTGNFKVRRDVVLARHDSFLQLLAALENRCEVASWAPDIVVERPRSSPVPTAAERP